TADRGAVTRADIISAVRELQWVEYSARPRPAPTPTLTTPTPTTQQQPQQPQSEPETALAAAAAGAEPGTTVAPLLVATEGRTVPATGPRRRRRAGIASVRKGRRARTGPP